MDKAIARMIDTTAQHLQLPRNRIFALSAQKALLAKVRDDRELLERSGVEALERFLAEEVVPMKRQILCRAVVGEIGGMMASSRASVAKKQQANQAEISELTGLVGKSRDVVTKLWGRITAEKNAYNAALAEFKVNQQQFGARRAAITEMLNPQKLDAMLASSAQAMEDSWTTVGLQRGMRELTRLMSENFEAVFAASEELKKMMQGVYDTFIQKFAFQPMTLPALDLDPHRTKLKLLVHETEAFAKDPVNVAHYKGPLVKKFYGTLVKQARATFTDAKSQTERWIQAVTLPLEVQIKDHKAQLQSRLDNLAKINEKTTTIHEQMATLRQAESELAKQRAMIDELVARVSVHEAKASLAPEIPAGSRAGLTEPIVLMAGTNAAQARVAPPQPKPAPRPASAAPEAAPMVSDDLLSHLTGAKPAPAFDPMATVKLEPESERTQRIEPSKPARAPDGDKTVQIPKLDPSFRPEATQTLDPASIPDAQATQRLDDSIWRLEEAKRILRGIGKK